jgi:hypothetical protein
MIYAQRAAKEKISLEWGFDESMVQKAEELLPRQSGSLEWRKDRDELGGDGVMSMMAGTRDIKPTKMTPQELATHM